MTATKSKAAPAPDDVDDMFGELDGKAAGTDDDFDDLLDQVVEDDSEGWVPDESGEGLAGTVIKVGKQRSDFAKDGEDPWCPAVTIETREGNFRVIGYGAVLRRELLDANPRVGDKIAVKYFGEKLLRKGRYQGKPYKHFGVAIRRTTEGENGKPLADAMAEAVK
jgi:hypothetical protein